MKNNIKSLAFLFATVSFTSCTNQAIEPIRSVSQPKTVVVRPDTTRVSIYITTKNDEQPTQPRSENLMLNDEFGQATAQPKTNVEPAHPPVPTPKAHPVVLPVEQVEPLEN